MNIIDNIEILGQVFELYLLVQDKKSNKLIIIDQHALHEKIIYSQLKLIKEVKTYKLDNPLILNFSNREIILIDDYIEKNKNDYFNLTKISNTSYFIEKIPLYLKNIIKDESIIKDIILEYCKKDSIGFNKYIDEIFKKIACKSAIRSGDICTIEQIKQLLNQAIYIENPYKCPHGRPTIIAFNKTTIDKLFKRSSHNL